MSFKIPKNSIFRPVVNVFTATFNSPTAGYYDWNVAANIDALIMQLNSQNIFFLASMNFSATVDEAIFLENIFTPPRVQFRIGQNKSALFGGSYPLAKYLISNEIGAFFSSQQDKDTLTATFTGALAQNANLIPYPSVSAVLALNVFEITDQDFIQEYHGHTKHNVPTHHVEIPDSLARRI